VQFDDFSDLTHTFSLLCHNSCFISQELQAF
jgi:hypothetical protein